MLVIGGGGVARRYKTQQIPAPPQPINPHRPPETKRTREVGGGAEVAEEEDRVPPQVQEAPPREHAHLPAPPPHARVHALPQGVVVVVGVEVGGRPLRRELLLRLRLRAGGGRGGGAGLGRRWAQLLVLPPVGRGGLRRLRLRLLRGGPVCCAMV